MSLAETGVPVCNGLQTGRVVLECIHDMRKLIGLAEGSLKMLTLHGTPGSQDDRTHVAVDRALSSLASCRDLARSIFDLAGPDGAVLDQAVCVSEVRAVCDRFAGMSAANITIDTESGTEDTVVALSPVALQRVVLNILSNSFDAVCDADVAIRVWSTRLPRRGSGHGSDALRGFLMLTMTDSGPGFPEPGSQHQDDVDHRGAGYGLGIVSALVRQAGGYVFFSNEQGAGARIDIALPTIAGSESE